MLVSEKNKRIGNIDLHLRKTARQLVKFDTVDETLHYLIESFWKQFGCHYVSIILKMKDVLICKASKGDGQKFEQRFPMERTHCSELFLTEPKCCHDPIDEELTCEFLTHLQDEGFATWFTVPIKESGSNSMGVCVIGYEEEVPLILNADKLFEEFGEDIAAAIGIAQQKEHEKKKIKGMEWLKDNVYLGSSIEQLVANITERAGKATGAESVYVYLYDDHHNSFVYQPPAFGPMAVTAKLKLEEDYSLFHHFPYVDREGGSEITIPFTVNLKTIGVLHVVKKEAGTFTSEDLELLQLLSSHISVLIENARLYKAEMEDKRRLEKLMVNQQELVKRTLVGEGFQEITVSLSKMLGRSVVLFDRFLRPISSFRVEESQEEFEQIFAAVEQEKWAVLNASKREQWLKYGPQHDFAVWKVMGGGDCLGYVGVSIRKNEVDMVVRITLNHALDVYAIQFIKQKLVLDVKEQVKDGFIHQLFSEKIEEKEKLIEYANLFNVNIFQSNKIAVFSIECKQRVSEEEDLLSIEAKKTWLWERIREELLQFDPGMMVSRKAGKYLLIVPEKKVRETKDYWEKLYSRMTKMIPPNMQEMDILLGIGTSTKTLEDYYLCLRQALQALKIVTTNYPSKKFLSFESLGSYSVLYNLQETLAAKMFVKNVLEPLQSYGNGNGKGKDLFDTLRVYLLMNGNLKETAEALFIHRSSLKYRLGKITELLKCDIDDAEERFNLMLAYKLYDLYEKAESSVV
ncbi:GAF domain-containing protein [Brevibacillus fluminis]|uniref:GAF domain-containing protein n=1 Tax=Brevibacillus fluminis TaxID=511487 RepID=A0A3M8DNU6_9BACL|nr:helix-turn-helix domain-containing protein [Brevibacillus fluminis]RNB89684.1 GAF domain-containing protein [Brevibacillus fluminis]